jgi:predicted dehydrogenase
MIHDFDWIRWSFGPVRRVYGRGLIDDPACAGKRDYALVTLRMESGAIAHVEGSWSHLGSMSTSFEIAGDAGMIEHDSRRETTFSLAAHENGSSSAIVTTSPLDADDDPYYLELKDFVDSLAAGVPPPVTVYDAAAAVSVSLGALESIRSGKAVTPL